MNESRHQDIGLLFLRVSSTDSLAIDFLIPAIARLHHQHPDVRVQLDASTQFLSLAKRETDIAVRNIRPDMAKIDVPTLVIHGDGDQIVPFETTGKVAAQMIKGAELKVYKDAPHGFAATHTQQLNEDLLAFLNR